MMTSFAFILGVVPLVTSVGAGAEMRKTLGTAVFSGMLGVTLFGIFLTPVFYYVIQWVSDIAPSAASEPADPETTEGRPDQVAPANGHPRVAPRRIRRRWRARRRRFASIRTRLADHGSRGPRLTGCPRLLLSIYMRCSLPCRVSRGVWLAFLYGAAHAPPLPALRRPEPRT